MECYACSNQAVRQCRRCARVYCELHGGDLCAECLKPASALPSFNLYRGSLLALLFGTAIALWLLVQEPDSGNGGVIISDITPSPRATQQVTTPTVALTGTPAATLPPGTTATPTLPPELPTATATSSIRTYVVQPGDTLLSIAEAFAPPGVSPFDYVNSIVAASGLSSSSDILSTGQTLVLP
jgi:hypothetical protein